MLELDFQPAAFRGHRYAGADRELDDELSTSDRLDLARSVVVALIRGGKERDVVRLTNTAFHVHHPNRDLTKRIDPAAEANLAAEWKDLKARVVMPALANGASATPAASTAPVAGAVTGTVLLVGDSHTHGAFGKELERLLESGGATVERHAKIGSAVKYWLLLVPKLLRDHRPGVVIVALGANMRGYPSAKGTSAQIRQLVDLVRREAPGARLVWIGPPRERKDSDDTLRRFNTIVRNGLDTNTAFVDSAPHTPTYRGSDGVHYAEDTAKQWARGVFTQLR